ncbi:hypothetical protein C9374_007579 [Naegleria lovaniensis]|uniref:Acyl-coenzyme A oxidase n=1 Tax=Naegleria lovaniensis TaxID=51637 RepID=A0AA88KI70_NAELO|nr:uncharacterized protein C9374_007579 [Naegleria lovaniensis]KAG2378941.1 hypothetical protein C9374_007579 [Naegleria lovaniensis]
MSQESFQQQQQQLSQPSDDQRRLAQLISHLFPSNATCHSDPNNSLSLHSCSGSSNPYPYGSIQPSTNDPKNCLSCYAISSNQMIQHTLERYESETHRNIRNRIYELVRKNPKLFERRFGLTKDEERYLSHDRLEFIIQQLKPFEMEHFKTDPKRIFTVLETLSMIDFGSCGRCMIHFGLFGASILFFGTEKHQPFLQRIVKDLSRDFFGMFCMSELNHASNVQAIETRAIYDHSTKTFQIVTPSDSAVKVWSGGAALLATWAIVFAQLIVNNENKGVHTFLVPIRSEKDHSVLPGIRIRDLGSKIGLNSLDNGRVWFDHVTIPKDYLLDRFGTITDEGTYKTSIPDAGLRFLSHVSALLIGRIMTASSSILALKLALEITLKHAIHRKQFGPTLDKEVPILSYLSYQRRFYPYLAFTYVMQFAVEDLKMRYEKPSKGAENKMMHTLADCLKAKCSETAFNGCQECRKGAGAQGFLSVNRIGEMRTIADASLTYEGDNTILYQTAARNLMKRGSTIPKLKKLTNLWDLQQLQQIFEFRDATIEQAYVKKTALLAKKTNNAFEASVRTQDLALKLCNSYVENHAIKVFMKEALESLSQENKNLGQVLERLALLLVFTWIQQDGFFLQHGLISSEQYGQLDDMINSICEELTPLVPMLIKSFNFPEDIVTNVPMGPKLVEMMAYDKIYD